MIVVVLVILGLLFAQFTFAQITTPLKPASTSTNVNTIGTVAWTNAGNALSNDDTYATVAVSGGAISNYLQVTNFGFTIPSEATITGIAVTIGRFENTTNTGNDVRDHTLRLMKAGVLVGDNDANTGTDWPTTEAAATYNGSTNTLWGTTWTPAEINASNFGIALAVNSTNVRTASVDYIQIQITYTGTYKSEFQSMSTGSTNWCQGEERTISVTVKNTGTLTWTTGWPLINLGVKWNNNSPNWLDYHIRTSANNLAPGATGTYFFTIKATDHNGTAYGSPLALGTNNLTFDVVYEGLSWFGDNGGGVGPGNAKYISPNQTIATSPLDKTVAAAISTMCAGNSTNITVTSSAVGTSYQLRNNSDNSLIGSPVVGNGGTINLPTGTLTSTTTFNVLATIVCSVQMTNTPTVTVNPLPVATVTAQANVSCFGGSDGSLTILASGGTGSSWSFSVNNGTNYTPAANPHVFGGLNATTAYAVRVKDAAGCESKSIQ